VLDADSVGLQACWYGSFYGDTEKSDFPTPSGGANTVAFDQKYGMHLWYADTENSFQQYGIYEDEPAWVFEHTWSGMNGHAGVGCYSWLPGSTTYAMFVNQENAVEIYWKDTDTNLTSTEIHPINSWVNSTNATIPNVYPSTSLGYTTYFYAMLEDSTIHGYNVSFSSENTTLLNEIVVSENGPVKFLNGTHMTVSAVPNASGGASALVFAQTNGSDITLFTRDLAGGVWTSLALEVDVDP